MKHLDLFSGIGGFALGLESTGHFKTVAFCEIEDFPRRVLARHWPNIPCYGDVRDVTADRLARDGIGGIDIVTGGFPCQDISLAGNRAGLSGERSGLWSELFRVIVEVRPTWAIVENVVGLRTLGADAVLADLAGAGYCAWPLVVGAVHAGAPHRRQRVWIVAHAENVRRHDRTIAQSGEHQRPQEQTGGCDSHGNAADSDSNGCAGPGLPVQPGEQGQTRVDSSWGGGCCELSTAWDWSGAPEPVLRRMDDGLPCGIHRRERLKALGNAVVPQIVAAIGRAIWRARPSS